jgi:TPP-dependent 2-oxoacid decarboxylase
MVNPVAASFSERVPILVISGGPGEEECKLGVLIHHQAREIESQLHIYREVTCAAKLINDPLRAAAEIDEVIRAIWLNQQPGYLEIHRDMVEREIPVPKEIVSWNGELPHLQSDRRKLDEAVRDTAERLSRAQRPLVLVGIEAYRFKAASEIVKLVEKMGVPCCTSVLAKGAFPMNHPLFMGVYAGAISPPPIRARVEQADLIIGLGMFLTDIEMGGSQPPEALRHRSIWAVGEPGQRELPYLHGHHAPRFRARLAPRRAQAPPGKNRVQRQPAADACPCPSSRAGRGRASRNQSLSCAAKKVLGGGGVG